METHSHRTADYCGFQHILFQVSNLAFLVAFATPNTKSGLLGLHTLLFGGFFLHCLWSWNIICASGVFAWTFVYMLANGVHALYLAYSLRAIVFPLELEDVYTHMFAPMKISRGLFQKLVASECAQVLTLEEGEAYAMQNLTRTDKLGLLLSGW